MVAGLILTNAANVKRKWKV